MFSIRYFCILAIAALGVLCGSSLSVDAQDGTVPSDGAQIHYITEGSGPTTLVLIPGFATSTDVWKAQVEHFSRTMRVVSIDPRGQGGSSKTDDGNTPEQRAADYEKVLSSLGLNSIVIVGWSQGVQDVAAYVEQFGTKRLRGIVLVDATVSKGSGAVGSNAAFVKEMLGEIDIYARYKRQYLEGMMQAIFKKPLSKTDLAAFVDTAMKTPTSQGVAMLMADFLGRDRTPALAKFDRPTLLIAAGNSSELAEQEAEVKLLPKGRFVKIDDAGHGVFVDQPKRFNESLESFFRELP